MSALARKRQEIFVSAIVASNPCESASQVAAVQISIDHVRYVRSPKSVSRRVQIVPNRFQLLEVVFHAIVELSLSGVAGPVDPGCVPVRSRHYPIPSGAIGDFTSLVNGDLYPCRIFKELYHKRWPVEEDCKAMKCWLQLENFSGKTVLSVYQDFHAKIFQNLTSVLCFSPQSRLDKDCKKRKYRHQVNFAQAL